MKKNWKYMKFERYIFGLLIALEIIMSFTFLGYIHVEPISVTTAYIPIVIIACLFGIGESTMSGLVFGLGSMYKASSSYVMPMDMIFSPFQSTNPLGSLILSVGTRVLFGFLIGCVFHLAKNGKHPMIWKGVAALIAGKMHGIIVYSAMGLFFREYVFSGNSTFKIERNDCIVAVLCMVLVLLADRFYNSSFVGKYKDAVNESENNPYWSSKVNRILGIIGAFVLCMAVLSTVHFANRMTYMLNVHEVDVTAVIQSDIMHLQAQFLMSMLALYFILLLVIAMVYRYMKYREYTGEIDALTGIMGRRLFLHYCTQCQKTEEGKYGWFLFLDLDYFKHINDSMGHSAGDEILRKFAQHLQRTFQDYGAVGRVGGDEFAMILKEDMPRKMLEQKLTQFLQDISGIWENVKVSSSIGAYHFKFPEEIKTLLTETDRVLYEAKANGRACFCIDDGLNEPSVD